MVFIPPIGKPSSATAESIAEETSFKVGEVLEGRVVRPVGDRYLFVDIGKQLRVKIHWEMPFEIKPGEILNFEVVSEDPLTFKLVDKQESTKRPYQPPSTYSEKADKEKVEISPNGKDKPPPKVTYDPLRSKRDMPSPKVHKEESLSPRTSAKEVAASETPDDTTIEKAPYHEEKASSLPSSLTRKGLSFSLVIEEGVSPYSFDELADSVVSLLADEPFFSLYTSEDPSASPKPTSNMELLKNIILKGLSEKDISLLRELFKGANVKIGDLLKTIQNVFEETLSSSDENQALDTEKEPTPQGSKGKPSHGENTTNVFKGRRISVEETIPLPKNETEEAGGSSKPSPPQGNKIQKGEETKPETNLAESHLEDIPLGKGGDKLAIRIWPATSRFTIESSTPPPPGLELDIGDMLQGKVVEVEGNKVIIDFGSFETQATWEAANTVKPGATIKVMVASLLPQLRLRLVDEVPFKGFMAKLGSMKGWGTLFSRLRGAIQNLPIVQADKGEGVLARTLANFISNNGLSTEARMAQMLEGELPPEELKNDLKLQLAQLIAKGGESSHIEAAKELMQSINGHQLLNVQTQNSGFFIIPLVVAYHQRIDEWRMTIAEEEGKGEKWFRITLLSSPPKLGTIRIDLSYEERSKRLDMLFWVEREETKELVEHAMPMLKEEFSGSKVNLTRVEVGISQDLSKEDLPIEVKRPHLLQMRV